MDIDLDRSGDEAQAKPTAQELRVLAGRAAGATAALEHGRWFEIGFNLSSDIVIRDPSARGVQVRLRSRLQDDPAELEILEGEVELLGHRLGAPAAAILPTFVPLKLGAAAIAFGRAGDPRWTDAARLLRAVEDTPAADEKGARDSLPGWRLMSPALRALGRYQGLFPAAVGAVFALSIVSLGWTSARDWLDRTPAPDKATALLARDGFSAVKVEPGDSGLVARGVLATAADVARLRNDIARRRWPVAVNVGSADQVETGVADTLRASGYQAEVRAIGPGYLVASVRGGDPTTLERVRQEALRDNPGLKRLVVNSGEEIPAASVSHDPGKQVVSVVGGDTGYVQTADGSRYFVGGVLPTGDTIKNIDGRNVTVSLNGRVTTLEF